MRQKIVDERGKKNVGLRNQHLEATRISRRKRMLARAEHLECKELGCDGKFPTSFALSTYSLVLEPGRVYGFIADSKRSQRQKAGQRRLPQRCTRSKKTSERELAPTIFVTVRKKTPIEVNVFGLIARRADYALYAYAWDAPTILNLPGADGDLPPQQ